MKKHWLSILFILVCMTSAVKAQPFSFRKLAELGEIFPKTCLPPADSIFNCPEITKGKSFVVRYNRRNEIEHLGVSLFSPETKEIIGLPVCNFIERIMLELLLQKSSAEVRSKLREYKISLEQNGVEYGKGSFTSLNRVLDEIQSPARFGIQKDSVYRAGWEFENGKRLKMSFPASRELISGMDKKESDASIGELFANEDCRISSNANNAVSGNKMTPVRGTDLYLSKGAVFMINQINSDTYYLRSDNLYYPAFSSDYPTESLVNLFITKQINNSLTLQVTHRMYGGFTPEFTIPLDKFICLFDKEFSTYCVLHRPGSGDVQVSVVLHNRDFNYVHLLRVKTTTKQLFRENGVLTADFYTNIPMHNLKSLFSQ
jgi:hypothetical protein